MKSITVDDIRQLYFPPPDSHKGQNGRLLIIGGSHLFHAASLWSLTVASRIVDLVHYASVPENNQIVEHLKEEFRNGIIIDRHQMEEYIVEDDAVLIGPGMVRKEKLLSKNQLSNTQSNDQKLAEILSLSDEGEVTEALTNYLLAKYPQKQWVIDAGALQMLDISFVPQHAILTPHQKEFEGLWEKVNDQLNMNDEKSLEEKVRMVAKQLQCVVLVKGEEDIVSDNGDECVKIGGGNAGMTKGGTGDVLAGLIAALSCKNDPLLATWAGSFINKTAGDELYQTMGPFFNATDLANQIPKTMKRLYL